MSREEDLWPPRSPPPKQERGKITNDEWWPDLPPSEDPTVPRWFWPFALGMAVAILILRVF